MSLLALVLFFLAYMTIGLMSHYIFQTFWYHGMALPDNENDKAFIAIFWPFIWIFILVKGIFSLIDYILQLIFYFPKKLAKWLKCKMLLCDFPDFVENDTEKAIIWIFEVVKTFGEYNEHKKEYRLYESGYVGYKKFNYISIDKDKNIDTLTLCDKDWAFGNYGDRNVNYLSQFEIKELCLLLKGFLENEIKK